MPALTTMQATRADLARWVEMIESVDVTPEQVADEAASPLCYRFLSRPLPRCDECPLRTEDLGACGNNGHPWARAYDAISNGDLPGFREHARVIALALTLYILCEGRTKETHQ